MPTNSSPFLAIVLTPQGPVMGSLLETADGWELRKPRAIQVQVIGNGAARIAFLELVGAPDVLMLPGEICYYVPTARNILDTYLESTSGIKVARAMPNGKERGA